MNVLLCNQCKLFKNITILGEGLTTGSVFSYFRAAFAAWILANVLMSSHIAYSACFLLFTGALKLLACIVYSAIQPTDFYIPKDDGSKVTLRFSWMYWVTLFVGMSIQSLVSITSNPCLHTFFHRSVYWYINQRKPQVYYQIIKTN